MPILQQNALVTIYLKAFLLTITSINTSYATKPSSFSYNLITNVYFNLRPIPNLESKFLDSSVKHWNDRRKKHWHSENLTVNEYAWWLHNKNWNDIIYYANYQNVRTAVTGLGFVQLSCKRYVNNNYTFIFKIIYRV
ncbi:UNVERIFIED_CONTAM: hypothetical protein LBW93_03045 [Wolbachia endosymbiont of Nasonia longicornis]